MAFTPTLATPAPIGSDALDQDFHGIFGCWRQIHGRIGPSAAVLPIPQLSDALTGCPDLKDLRGGIEVAQGQLLSSRVSPLEHYSNSGARVEMRIAFGGPIAVTNVVKLKPTATVNKISPDRIQLRPSALFEQPKPLFRYTSRQLWQRTRRIGPGFPYSQRSVIVARSSQLTTWGRPMTLIKAWSAWKRGVITLGMA